MLALDDCSPLLSADPSSTAPDSRVMKQSDKSFCAKVLKTLRKHRRAAPFLAPVDPIALNCPDYFDVIKNPMDLGTIQEKLRNEEYETVEEFIADVNLMFDNCYLYNNEGDPVTLDARSLQEAFHKCLAHRPQPPSASLPSTSSSGVAPSSAASVSSRKMPEDQFKRCAGAVKELKKPKYSHLSWLFEKPVDPTATGAPDYYDVIKHPMDMSTFEHKLYSDQYSNEEEFEADVRLMFRNCYTYNPPHNSVHQMGRQFEEVFDAYWTKVHKKAALKAEAASTSVKDKLSDIHKVTEVTSTPVKDKLFERQTEAAGTPISVESRNVSETASTSQNDKSSESRKVIVTGSSTLKEKPSEPRNVLRLVLSVSSDKDKDKGKEKMPPSSGPRSPQSSTDNLLNPPIKSSDTMSHIKASTQVQAPSQKRLAISKNPPLSSSSVASSSTAPLSSKKSLSPEKRHLSRQSSYNSHERFLQHPGERRPTDPSRVLNQRARDRDGAPSSSPPPKPKIFDLNDLCDKIYQESRQREKERREQQELEEKQERALREKYMKEKEEENRRRREFEKVAEERRRKQRDERMAELNKKKVDICRVKRITDKFEYKQVHRERDWRDLYFWQRETLDYRHLPAPGFIKRSRQPVSEVTSKLLSEALRYRNKRARNDEEEEGEADMDVE